jgi:hypothetical protein
MFSNSEMQAEYHLNNDDGYAPKSDSDICVTRTLV